MTAYYINKKRDTLVRVTYDPTKRLYTVMDYSRLYDEQMTVTEFCERCKKEYEPIRRAKIVTTAEGEFAIVVRSASTKEVRFKTFKEYSDAYRTAIHEDLPLVTYVQGVAGIAVGLNTSQRVLIVSKYYKKDYYLLRAFDREYNK